jgi:hypothetical protein
VSGREWSGTGVEATEEEKSQGGESTGELPECGQSEDALLYREAVRACPKAEEREDGSEDEGRGERGLGSWRLSAVPGAEGDDSRGSIT